MYDFWIPSQNLLIEYDGEQHYKNVQYGSTHVTNLVDVQERDRLKDEYAQKNGMRLLRIPFFEFDNIISLLDAALNCV